MEGLKNNLKEQDKRIENLKEKVNILEAQVRREPILHFVVKVLVCMCACVCVSVRARVSVSVSLCMKVCNCMPV